MSYEEAFLALKAGEYERAAKLFEPAAREMGYGSDIINNAYTLALHLTGDQSRLADVAFRVGKMLLPDDPASALDYFQRALFAGLDGNRSRQIGEVFEEWSEAVREEDGGGKPSGPIRRVAHVVGCLLPGHAPSIYLQSLTRSLNSHGIASTIFTTEWASSWFFNPKDVGQSQQLDIDADVRIASVEGDFFERAERVADAVRQSGCDAAFYHASLAEQITARVASLHPASVQVNVNHGGEMAAALFDASIHLFHNALERTQFPDRQNTWIPLASDIEARLDATPPADRRGLGLAASGTVSATFGNLYKISGEDYLRTLTEILRRFPSHIHLFAGSGDVRPARSYLHRAEVLPQVRFLGHQSDVSHLLPLIDVYIASFPHSGGHSLLEAMGAGKPVVVLGYPSDSHYNSGAELVGLDELVAAGQEAFIEIADKLIRDADYRDAVSQAVQERFRREFRPEHLGRRYKDFLDGLVQGQ